MIVDYLDGEGIVGRPSADTLEIKGRVTIKNDSSNSDFSYDLKPGHIIKVKATGADDYDLWSQKDS